jgi:hypothetical protein
MPLISDRTRFLICVLIAFVWLIIFCASLFVLKRADGALTLGGVIAVWGAVAVGLCLSYALAVTRRSDRWRFGADAALAVAFAWAFLTLVIVFLQWARHTVLL